jgi:hypothetical protein
MPILLVALTLIIQGCFIYHVFKTRRPYWWAFIIMSFPVIGCVIYYFVEVFPQSREARTADRAVNTITKKLDPGRAMRARVEDAEICGSLDNKIALADECMKCGLFDDAVRLYRHCMQGMYAEDTNLMLLLATALLEKQAFSEAQSSINHLMAKYPKHKPNEAQLLLARTYEGLKQSADALALYEALTPVYVGLEARCRYAMLLKTLGYEKQAYATFNELLTHASRHKIMHEGERNWIDIARQELRT